MLHRPERYLASKILVSLILSQTRAVLIFSRIHQNANGLNKMVFGSNGIYHRRSPESPTTRSIRTNHIIHSGQHSPIIAVHPTTILAKHIPPPPSLLRHTGLSNSNMPPPNAPRLHGTQSNGNSSQPSSQSARPTTTRHRTHLQLATKRLHNHRNTDQQRSDPNSLLRAVPHKHNHIH